MSRVSDHIVLLLLVVSLVSCKSVPSTPVISDKPIPHLLSEGSHQLALAEYQRQLESGEVDPNVMQRFGPYFDVMALYNQPMPQTTAEQHTRYASCAELTLYGEEVVQWRPIAAVGNPLPLSKDKVAEAQEMLQDLGYWRGPVDGVSTIDFQMAVTYYRYIKGGDVQCILYPHNLMLKSTFCLLFDEDIRCLQKHEF